MTDYDLRDSGFINYDAAANIERELREQYAVQEAEGNPYKRPRDLDTIFRGQAAKLAAQGVESIYDLMPTTYERDGRTITNLLNKRTGDVLREARVTEGWQTDPTAVTFKKTRNAEGQVVNQPIELKDRNGYFQWGADTSVSDMARYGINFVDGTPVFNPVYKDTTNFTTSDALKTAAAIAAAYYGGQYLLGGEPAAAAGAAEAGTAAAGTGAGISGAGLTSAEMAALKGAEGYGAGLLGPGTAISGAGLTSAEMAALKGSEAAYGAASPGMAISGAGLTSAEMAALKGAEAYGPGVASGMSLGNALQLANLANTVFNPPKLPQQGPLGNRAQSQFSLPAPQQTIVGLLQPAEPYRRSLI